jgi:hypothetical protein
MTGEPAEITHEDRRTGPMGQLIDGLASGLGNSIGWLADHGVLFGIFAIVWIAFGVALVWSQGSLDQAWRAIGSLPLIVQVFGWILFLPVMAGLWVWETTWPFLVRIVLVLGIAGWNLLVFLPRAAQAVRP